MKGSFSVFNFCHLDSSEALKNFASEKLVKVERFLHEDDEVEIIASFNPKRNLHRIDIQIIADGAHAFDSHEETEDMYNSIDMAIDKMENSCAVTKRRFKLKSEKPPRRRA